MTRPKEILPELIDLMRTRRTRGARASEIVHELQRQGVAAVELTGYLELAFCLDECPNFFYMARDEHGLLNPDSIDTALESEIDAVQETWKQADRYPDLLRRRDRHTFRRLARNLKCTVIVCAANHRSAQYIGKPGYRPFSASPFAFSRTSPPNEGLVAADPDDPGLRAFLESCRPAVSYQEYCAELDCQGFKVSPAKEGFVLRDSAGAAYYPGYYLHGVYREDGVNAWTGSQGPALRAELNRQFGAELINFGPHDCWDRRLDLDPADVRWGPQSPVLFFLPSGNVEVQFDAPSIERHYRFLGIDWDSLYPAPSSSEEPTP